MKGGDVLENENKQDQIKSSYEKLKEKGYRQLS